MRPDGNAINILSTTRATAKMHKFRVAAEDFIVLPRDPSILFALAVGLLGDVAATVADMPEGDAAPLGELPVPQLSDVTQACASQVPPEVISEAIPSKASRREPASTDAGAAHARQCAQKAGAGADGAAVT